MKKLILIIFVLIPNLIFAAPSSTISIPNSFTPNTTISSSSVNSNFNTVQTTYNAHTHSDITQVGAITSGTWQGNVVEKTYGGTGVTTGLGLPAGAVFFMVSGSCPTGTTDVSTTYSDKFVKINATAGTSSDVVLTGTSDSTTLTEAQMPAHTHPQKAETFLQTGTSVRIEQGSGNTINSFGGTTQSTGGGTGHTHPLSTATTLAPSAITMKACRID